MCIHIILAFRSPILYLCTIIRFFKNISTFANNKYSVNIYSP